MVGYNFKTIHVVPTGKEFIDVILSKTQRKTPTVVHPGYKISRIRNFYMRKVKFTEQNFREKFQQILEDFPRLEDIHPFYADLMNVLYDKDHYKLALGHVHSAKALCEDVAKDYVRLLKYGDSLYRCKMLKRAALGRMCTIVKKLNASLSYLEEVRKHLARMPSIDPNTRTLMMCGYPNVGKSSFMNKVTRANVEVQPYAFTTKSLFVGHMDYKYNRWQVIDTPGILDQPLEQMTTIEMQAVTALAHLHCCVLYFIDVSEQCGYPLKAQVSLFNTIKPLFANKPLIVVANKIDLRRMEDLSPEDRVMLENLSEANKVHLIPMSNISDEGIVDVKTKACDILLEFREQKKTSSSKISQVLNRLHVAGAGLERAPHIPVSVGMAKQDAASGIEHDKPQTEKDLQESLGGAGVYSADMQKRYLLADIDWRYDRMPEFMDGKNIADFVDPDILQRLEELEKEEELLEAAWAEEQMGLEEVDPEQLAAAKAIRDQRRLTMEENRTKKSKNSVALPQNKKRSRRDLSDDEDEGESRGRSRSRSRVKRHKGEDMDAEGGEMARSRSRSRHRSKTPAPRPDQGIPDPKKKEKAVKFAKKMQKDLQENARKGEADRHVSVKLPKHLFSGKRSNGTASHR